ncbi:MAG: glycosyl transferase, partial [bacterium]|nr:glycosyl transferase [bacterium]
MNSRRKKVFLWAIFGIFLAGSLFIRFWRFGEIPPGLNRDEASIGYTAYSLLKSGADEYGRPWPLSIQSFGDWK